MYKKVNYEERALKYAEKYGITTYQIDGNTMVYKELFPSEGTYICIVSLRTMKEKRKQI